jgi:hypothetical protein
VIFIDALMIKIRDGVVPNRPVYLAIGIDCDGLKQVLGLWVGPSAGESAKFWMSVLSELKGRGVADVCIVCCDGLTGLPDAIGAVWPQAVVQLCVVHLMGTWAGHRFPTLRLEPLIQAAGSACWPVLGTRCSARGQDPSDQIRDPAPAALKRDGRRRAGPDPRGSRLVPVWLVVA